MQIPQGTGDYGRSDVYIDFGPRDRYIFDGSMGFKAPTGPQMQLYARYAYGVNNDLLDRIVVVRPDPRDSRSPFTPTPRTPRPRP